MSKIETKKKCAAALYDIAIRLTKIGEVMPSNMCLVLAKGLSDDIEGNITEEIREIAEEIKLNDSTETE